MRVRIQRKSRSRTAADSARREQLALLLAAIMSPNALLAFTMALWKIASDLRLTGPFVVSSGVFSHWQTWLAIASALALFASALNRIGRGSVDDSYGRGAVSRGRS